MYGQPSPTQRLPVAPSPAIAFGDAAASVARPVRDPRPHDTDDRLDAQELDRALVHGIAWTGGLKWVTQFGTWTIALVVARLVTPSGYGLFAMAIVYTGLVQFVNDLGLDIALLQDRDLAAAQISELGGLAALMGVVLCALSMAVAPLVGAFFGQHELLFIVRVLSLTFMLRGLQVVPRALLARKLQFRRLAWINTVESAAWSATTLLAAALGFGVWALVVGALASVSVATVALWWNAPHRLAWPRHVRTIWRTTQLGWYVTVSRLCWYLYDHADLTLVGWALGTSTLGMYAKASDVADIPVDRISSLVGQVTPAVFGAARTDVAVLRRHLRGLTEGLALVTFPMAVGLALVADVFVVTVLGDAWRPAIVPLRLLALLGGFRSIFNMFPQALIATGRAKLNAKLNGVMAVGVIGALATGTHWGATGVAVSWLVSVPLIAVPMFFRPTLKILGISWREYLATLWPATTAVVGIGVAVLALRLVLPPTWPPARVLASCVVVGATAYAAVLLIAHRPRLRGVAALVPMLRVGQRRASFAPETIGEAASTTAAPPRLDMPANTPSPAFAAGAQRASDVALASQWARVSKSIAVPLRRGAWYPALSVGADEVVVVVQQRPTTMPRALVDVRDTPPNRWSFVSTSPDSSYVVCPRCAARAPVRGLALPFTEPVECIRCHGAFASEVA